jgi:hypothetical protein
MFKFPRKNNKIEFYTPLEELLHIENTYPSSSSDMLKNFMKAVKTSIDNRPSETVDPIKRSGGDIRQCPGIVQYMKTGYIIKAWQDIYIETDEEGNAFHWRAATERESIPYIEPDLVGLAHEPDIASFPKDIFFDFFPRENTLKQVIKINCPWFVKLPKGYGALMLPVFHDNEERFTVLPGLLLTDYMEKLNIQVYWHRLGPENGCVIKAGTPLAKIIPIKLENWDVEVRKANLLDVKKRNIFHVSRHMYFMNTWKMCTKTMDNFVNKK